MRTLPGSWLTPSLHRRRRPARRRRRARRTDCISGGRGAYHLGEVVVEADEEDALELAAVGDRQASCACARSACWSTPLIADAERAQAAPSRSCVGVAAARSGTRRSAAASVSAPKKGSAPPLRPPPPGPTAQRCVGANHCSARCQAGGGAARAEHRARRCDRTSPTTACRAPPARRAACARRATTRS